MSINKLLFWRENTTFGARRSPSWKKVRKAFLKTHPTCAACGKKGKLRANPIHHVMPFHLDNSLELSQNNLITLCRKHHFFIGHLNSWHSHNSAVRGNSAYFLNKIKTRP